MAKPCSIFGAYLMSRSFEQVSIGSNASIMNEINMKRRNYYNCQHKLHSLSTDAIRVSLCIKELCSLALGHVLLLVILPFHFGGKVIIKSTTNVTRSSTQKWPLGGRNNVQGFGRNFQRTYKSGQHSGRRVLKSTETAVQPCIMNE